MTAPRIRVMKSKGEKVVCLTAYDVLTGALADAAGADLILVGDSVGNTVLGYDTTLPVNLADIAHHVRATRNGVQRAMLVADMPFGSYGASVAQAVESAVTLVKAGADGVKLEGTYIEEILAIRKMGIPVMGHVGMTPQSVNNFGGFRVQGRGDDGDRVLQEAKQIEEAGAFSIVLELIPAELATRITEKLEIPTIGIGAGPSCAGEIQVIHDILGLAPEVFRHAQRYVEGRKIFTDALARFVQDVRGGKFPTDQNAV
jgi:3-methyl-2-oxobutanoate hydroxymethyltransferase